MGALKEKQNGGVSYKVISIITWVLFFLQPVFWSLIFLVLMADSGDPSAIVWVIIGIASGFFSVILMGFLWAAFYRMYEHSKKTTALIALILESFLCLATVELVLGLVSLLVTFFKLKIAD